ncbi:hypothetical protein, partial [Carnobacterium sp. AT7]
MDVPTKSVIDKAKNLGLT